MLKTIDLFAGAGGLSYGFESTGEFLIVAAAENNKNARKTYIENHKGRNDIRLLPDVRDYDFLALASEFDGIDVVIGGPPCQGFSNANRQKNHIISMNNSLVKEYFRAVKEIRPKAFVMENVSMLSSETHRFYDSAKDHDVVTSLGVQMREDELVLADSDYNGYSLMNIIQADAVADYKISDELFQLLNVLYKNRNSEERLSKYIKNKSKLIIDKIASQAEEVKNNLGILNWIVDMINTEQISACFTELGQFIKFQKTFRLKEELDSNEIIYEIENDLQTGKIIARVKSYSVIEYVNKILGDDYKKNSGVINSLWFGVPQERRRFIMIGVRSDIIQEKEIEMPEGNGAEIVTVGQAIGDLRDYEVDEEDNEPEKLPYDSSTENLSDYARIMRKGSEGISNHIVPKSRDKAKARFAALKEGENFHNLDNGLKDNYAVPERTQNSIYLRLDSNRPSGTVINVRKSMWIHPTIDRAISVREAARLQSFPDRFVFKGTKDAQYQQVGNAVPPLMARKRRQADISMKKNGGSKRKKKEEERKRKYHKKSNNKKGTGTGKASEVLISGIRTPFDKATGEYQISFVLDENAEDLVVGIRIGSDDDNLSKANISEATMNGKKLPIKNDMIELKGIHNEGEKNILRVKLEEKTRRTLEVRAYAKH